MNEQKYGKWILPVIIVIAIAIVIWDFAQQKQKKDISQQKLQQELTKAIENKDFDKAIKILEKRIEEKTDDYKSFDYLIKLYLAQNLSQKAYQQIDKAIEKIGEKPELLALKAMAFQFQGKADKAYESAKAIALKYPEYLPIKMTLVKLAISRNDFTIAEKYIKNIKQKHPHILLQYPDLYLSEANIYLKQGNFEQTKKYTEIFLNKHPYVYQIQKDWIYTMLALGKLPEVKGQYSKMIAKSSDPREKLFYQQLYSLLLPTDKSILYIQKILISHNTPILRIMLLQKLIEAGEYKDALEQFEILEKANQVNPESLISQAYILAKLNKIKESEKILKSLLSNPVYETPALIRLVHLELTKQNYKMAEKYIDDVLSEKKSNTHKHLLFELMKAQIAYQKGEMEKASKITEDLLAKTFKGEKIYTYTLFQLGQIYLQQKKYDQAVKIFKTLANQQTQVGKYRLRASIWHGIALFLAKKSYVDVWKQYSKIPWENYFSEDEEIKYLKLLSGENVNIDNSYLKKVVGLSNDIYYYIGLKHEIDKNYDKALKFYEKGLKESQGTDFPFYQLEIAKKRVLSKK